MGAQNSALTTACNDTVYKPIQVEGYDVYNVFTPNNDGINDVFHFNEWMLNGIYVEIFNRWGQNIYHWDDVNSGWEGRAYNGRNVEEGVYFIVWKQLVKMELILRKMEVLHSSDN